MKPDDPTPAATTEPPRHETEVFVPPAVPGYEIVEQLGRGGMGVVYMARHVPLNRTVALKMIRGTAEADDLVRFRTEAEASARLQHPNIVQVYEVGTADGRPYLSLEYVAGGSLDRAVAGSPQAPRLAAATVERLARAVHAAHDAGILHRDLKPANVLLGPAPRDSAESLPWVPKVADFGLAKRLADDTAHTHTGAILGTPSYMAPEQASGRKDVGPAADTYALGAILYHMLTGRPPFRAASSWDTIYQVIHDDPLPPSAFHPKLPVDLETVCLKCLHKDPARRYASAEALADDLRRFLDGRPVTARPAGTRERVVKWVRRRPATAGLIAAAAIAALSLVGGVVAMLKNRDLTAARNLAEDRRKTADEQRDLADDRKRAAERSAAEADKQRGVATAAKGDADTQRRLAERFQYIAHVGLAQRAWDEGDAPRALDLLERYRPKSVNDPDRRAFEWYHLRRASRNLLAVQAHREDVQGVAFHPNGRWLASAGWDNVVRVSDAATGAEVKALTFTPTGAWQRAGAVAFDRTGARLAVTFAQTAFVFDTETWRELAVLKGHTAHVSGVCFSPDGSRVATAGSDGAARIWDTAAGKELFALPAEPREMVRAVCFSPDGAALAWASALRDPTGQKVTGGGGRVWDLANRKPTFARTWEGRGADDCSFDPTGGRVAFAAGSSIRVIEVPSGNEAWTAAGHANGTLTARFSPDGKVLASGGYDLTVRVWDAATGKERLALRGHAGRETTIQARGVAGVNHVAFSPDGNRLASAADGGRVMVWDVAAPPAPAFPEAAKKFGPEDVPFAVAAHGGKLGAVAFSPDGKLVATATASKPEWGPADSDVKVWDVATGRLVANLREHTWTVRGLAWNRRGDHLATASMDGRLMVWHATDGRLVQRFAGARGGSLCVAFSPDSSRLASGGADKTVRLWDVFTGDEVLALKGHTTPVTRVEFAADGGSLMSRGSSGEWKAWDARPAE